MHSPQFFDFPRRHISIFFVGVVLQIALSPSKDMVQSFLGAFFLTFVAFIFVSFGRLWQAMSSWLQELRNLQMAASPSLDVVGIPPGVGRNMDSFGKSDLVTSEEGSTASGWLLKQRLERL